MSGCDPKVHNSDMQVGGERRGAAREHHWRLPPPRSLVRARLTGELDDIWEHRLTLVSGPAGVGKTTLLHQLTDQTDAPVAWYDAEPGHSSAAGLLLHLQLSATASFGGLAGDWGDAEQASASLAEWSGHRGLVVVDDLHVLDGSEAERTLAEVITRSPAHVRFVVASRCVPRTNLSRLRVAGDLHEIDADALRFRSWEVEELFDLVYEERLAPADAALLTRRMGGWAAGLQLFHLASSGHSYDDRRRLLSQISSRSRHVRDYLAENVLCQLPESLRTFLLDTFALGDHLDPALCDELLASQGSEAKLEELSRRQVFTADVHGLGTYRYHEVLRTHLEEVVRQAHGDVVVQQRHRAAAALLEREGAVMAALVALTRGCAWSEVSRLARERDALVDRETGWLDSLPPGMVEHDPWLLLARARREVAQGSLDFAVASYSAASVGFGPGAAGDVCRNELTMVRAWASGGRPAGQGWLSMIRRALIARPRESVVADPSQWQDHVVNAMVAWLDGTIEQQDRSVLALTFDERAPATASLVAQLLAGPGRVLTTDPSPLDDAGAALVRRLVERAEATGLSALARAASALLALADPDDRIAASAARESERIGDRLGTAFAHLVAGVAGLAWGRPAPASLTVAAQQFTALEARTLAAWAQSLEALSLSRIGDPGAAAAAASAERLAREVGVANARLVAVEAATAARAPQAGTDGPALRITCFGGLEVRAGEQEVDLTGLKPRARSVLRLLALHTPTYVHSETIVDALWPATAPDAARRSLQVAVSSLRSVIDPLTPHGLPSIIGRLDDAYRLASDVGLAVDILEFDEALRAARVAGNAGDRERRQAELARALDLHRGDLFPLEGPAEWVLAERDRRRRQAASAALDLAELLVLGGELRGAIEVCERGVAFDPWDDSLWRTLITAHERRGARAAASRARAEYARLLAELGVEDLVTP